MKHRSTSAPTYCAPTCALIALLFPLFLVGCGRSESEPFSDEQKVAMNSGARAPQDFRDAAAEKEILPAEEPDLPNTEEYDAIEENNFVIARNEPLSTFSIDVDTASYSNARRMLNQGQLPPRGAVRVEEFVNYFSYDYPQPRGAEPFSVNAAVSDCPWKPEHRLVRIGLKGKEVSRTERPAANLVFLLDVSGSMGDRNKLPLVKQALGLLLDQLEPRDRVAITVYAGASGIVLPSTPADQRGRILDAMDRLKAGGSTNGGEGIDLAYQVATDNFIPEGINRVILCTDGDFNVGQTSQSALLEQITAKAKSGVFLNVLGFGMGNYKDNKMELLADKGNGVYGYIDTLKEARKIFVEGLTGTLVTIAKDVKIQIDFNPAHVQAYRLIGYENRMLQAEDFKDDTKDAGEIGAGHTVTAFYEVIPTGVKTNVPTVEPSKYIETKTPVQAKKPGAQKPGNEPESEPRNDLVQEQTEISPELLTVRLRYKLPDSDTSSEFRVPLTDAGDNFESMNPDFKFATAVASFALVLRDSKYKGNATLESVNSIARQNLGFDPNGYRKEFLNLVQQARNLKRD